MFVSGTILWLVVGLPVAVYLLEACLASSSGPGAPAAAKRLDSWIVIGPGGGGAQYIPTVSPHDPKKVFVRCDMTGSYVSEDAGKTWRMFNLRGVVRFFVFDPVDPDTVYAQACGLFRSTDGGKTWKLVHPAPSKVKRMKQPDDHARVDLVTIGRYRETVLALAVDPSNSKVLYAAMDRDGEVGLFISTDYGATWKKDTDLPGGALKVYVDPKSPAEGRTVYVVGNNSVNVRREGTWVRQKAVRGVERFIDVSAGFPADGGEPIIYAAAPAKWRRGSLAGGLYVSRNGGETWRAALGDLARKADGPSPAPSIRGVACCLTRPEVAYIGFKNLRFGRGKKECFGSAKTTDAGKTWGVLVKETDPGKPSPNVKGAWPNEEMGPIWGDAPRYLGVDPNNPDRCYTTDDGRTMRTTDGGATWRACFSKRAGKRKWTTTGLDVTTCYGVHFDPFDKERVFISYTDIGLFRSEDGGRTWTRSIDGFPRDWHNTTYWIEFDPAVKGRAWAVASWTHDLPRPKMWRRGAVSRYNGGVCVTSDGARTWKRSTRGMPETACTHILLDAKSPIQARTLYVTGFGTGVWKSVNGGASWQLKNNGIEGAEPFAWRLAIDGNGVLYLVVARRSDDGSFGNEFDGALYRSTDGAEHWVKVRLPRGVNGPNGLAIDPGDPDRFYLAAWGRDTDNGAVDGGIYLSSDAGRKWTNVLSKDRHVYDVTIDPKDPRVLYATGFESSVWRSENRGKSWKRIKGCNFKWGHRVTVDPRNRRRVYVATFGGSVWYGPAKGDPKAVEDIVTPAVRY
ncbi:MAG: WD40/YVTN/BNR-like repeat-containing protein [Planctomycetota bacterium]|jgi:photosystem II stability/assembly factor-like uncharacterized protein